DAKLLASVSSNYYQGELLLRDLATGLVRPPIHREFGFFAVAFRPDGTSVAAAGGTGVSLWAPAAGRLIRLLPVHRPPVGGPGTATSGVAFTPDARRVAAAGTGGVTVWEAASGRVLQHFRAHPLLVHNFDRLVAFSPDGRRLATATHGGAAGRQGGAEQMER